MLVDEMRAALAAAPRERLCDLSKMLWQAFAAGALTEAEAEELSGLIEARRVASRHFDDLPGARQATHIEVAKLAKSNGVAFGLVKMAKPKPQRPPVRSVAVERRRRLAASGPMPPALAARFTTGELAVMRIVADEHRDRGSCRLCLDAIAARAGVSRSLAKAAIRQARRLGMVEVVERRRVGAKSLPNVVTVVDREWLAWIRRGRRVGQNDQAIQAGMEGRKSRQNGDNSQAGIGGRFQTTTEILGFREGASRTVEARARSAADSHNSVFGTQTGPVRKLSGGENRGRR